MYLLIHHMKSFIAECSRRRVFRVAAIYILTAWLVLQVGDLAFDSWGIPAIGLRHVWIGAVLGFPIALFFGWRFDIVGGRIIRTQDDDSPADSSLHLADRIILSAIAVVTVAILYNVSTEISAIQPAKIGEIIATSVDPKSIAVLPFKNTSQSEDSAQFLAIGIQEDLLTRLSKIAELKVISRTSVARYQNTTKSMRTIGMELGVGKILEGGVQRSGNQIRINVQLIDTETDEHIWAQTYDRSLTATNVFEMQSSIVETIVQQLQASLTPEESAQLMAMPTKDFAAYTAYLKGRNHADAESVESLHEAIELFETAIDLDPNFALAYVGLADAYLTLGTNFMGALKVDESNALAEPPLVRALELDSALGQAYATLGLLRQQQGNFRAAEQAYDQAISLQPSYSRVFRLYGRLRWRQGDRDAAMTLYQKALDLDPYSAPVNFQIARALDESGQFEEALTRYLQVIQIEPDHAFAYVYIAAIHFLVFGQADESLVWYHKAAKNDALSPSLQAAQGVAYLEIGDPDSAREWVEKALELEPKTFWSIWVSLLLNVYVGDDAAAQQDARTMHEGYPKYWGALYLLRNADLKAGRYAAARSRYARVYRELTEPETPRVDSSNYFAAVDLALVLMHLGEQERADDLLQGSMAALENLPRHGTNGFMITDVRIFSLQQKPRQALNALRQAIDEGWRVLTWFYLEHDPGLDTIRDEPEFRQLYAELQADLAVQAMRVQDLKASGQLAPIAEHRVN